MIVQNYLITALRNFRRRKLYTFINAAGLSIAVTFCILVYLFIADEISFDRFHTKADRIYRIHKKSFYSLGYSQGNADPYQYDAILSNRLGDALRVEAPEAELVTQLKPSGKRTIRYNDKILTQNILFADSSFFKVFSFELYAGSPHKLFNQPADAVLSREAALRLFGNEDAVGKTFYLDFDQSLTPAYTVKAVVSCPTNSSIIFDIVLPLQSYKPYETKVWNTSSYPTFVLLHPQATTAQLKTTLDTIVKKNRSEWINQVRAENNLESDITVEEYMLTPLEDIHFEKKVTWSNVSDPQYSWILGAIALLIISIAGINYVSFALTSSTSRKKEVGIRKAIGASRSEVFQQFNLESFGLVCGATLIGVAGAVLVIPIFNTLTQKNISVLSVNILHAVFFLGGLIVTLTLLAGSYPSLFISRIQPVLALKGSGTGARATFVRPLIALQFAMSTFLMISALIMFRQMNFIATRNLGYSSDNVISFPTHLGWGENSDDAVERFRNETRSNHDILNVSGASGSFIRGGMSMTIAHKGTEHQLYLCRVDHAYLPLLNIELVQGRNFEQGSVSDSSSIIVNEALVREMGWENPLTERLSLLNKKDLTVIGVVKDYHFQSLEEEIKPMVLFGTAAVQSYMITMIVKLHGDDLPKSLASAEAAWKKLYPDKPFEYTFADADIALQYASYLRWMKIAGIATAMALLIAGLGLFGLAGINALNRTKEISIRKVLGANFSHIFLQLNKPFFILAFIAFVIALPASWQLMNMWLNNFQYHITLGAEIFIVSFVLAALIVLMTLSYHSIKTANVNPTESLKHE